MERSRSSQDSNEEPRACKGQGLAKSECSGQSISYSFSGDLQEQTPTVASPTRSEESNIADLLAMLPKALSNASTTSSSTEQRNTPITKSSEIDESMVSLDRNEALQNSEDMLYNLSDDFSKLQEEITSKNSAGPAEQQSGHATLGSTQMPRDEKQKTARLASRSTSANLSGLNLGTSDGRAVRRRRILYTMTVQEFG